jgi:hypothetical protein
MDTAAHRTAVVATRSLGVSLGAMLVGVIVLFFWRRRSQPSLCGWRRWTRMAPAAISKPW